jgi:hypothetical protein
MKEEIKTYTARDLDEARKQGYQVAEELYLKVIKRMKEENGKAK